MRRRDAISCCGARAQTAALRDGVVGAGRHAHRHQGTLGHGHGADDREELVGTSVVDRREDGLALGREGSRPAPVHDLLAAPR